MSDRVTVTLVTAGHESNEDVRVPLLVEAVECMAKDPGTPYELIIVVNRTTPKHASAVRKLEAEHEEIQHVVWNKHNLAMTGGWRVGMAMAEGDYLVNMTDDVWLGPGWLDELLTPFRHLNMDAYRADSNIVKRQRDRGFLTALSTGFAVGKLIGEIEIDGRSFRFVTRADPHCYCWRRRDYIEIGPWLSKQDEDSSMASRLESSGFCWIMPVKQRTDAFFRVMSVGREGESWDFSEKRLAWNKQSPRTRPWRLSDKRCKSQASWREVLDYWRRRECTED